MTKCSVVKVALHTHHRCYRKISSADDSFPVVSIISEIMRHTSNLDLAFLACILCYACYTAGMVLLSSKESFNKHVNYCSMHTTNGNTIAVQ